MTWQSGKEKPKQSESEKEKQVKLDAALTSKVGRGLEKLRKIEKNGGRGMTLYACYNPWQHFYCNCQPGP